MLQLPSIALHLRRALCGALHGADEELLLQIGHLRKHFLEAHIEKLLLELLKNEHSCLEDRFPSVDDEVIPNAKQLPHVFTRRLVLHRLSEQRDEVAGAKVTTIDTFFLQVNVQIWQQYRDKTVEAVKV